jgi:hypothetical protein
MIVFFIKVLIVIAGLVTTMVYVVKGLLKNGNRNFKAGLIALFATGGLLILTTSIEFIIHDRSKDYSKKRTTLVAMREASLGGIHLRVYVDSTYELGDGIEVSARGEVKVKGDTLFLLTNQSIDKAFIVDQGVLHEIKNSGINFLEIESNELIPEQLTKDGPN